jgi:hypothetical protein
LGVANAFAMLRLLPMSNRDKDVEIHRHIVAVAIDATLQTGVRKSGPLLDRQGVHVGAQQNGRARTVAEHPTTPVRPTPSVVSKPAARSRAATMPEVRVSANDSSMLMQITVEIREVRRPGHGAGGHGPTSPLCITTGTSDPPGGSRRYRHRSLAPRAGTLDHRFG